MGAASKSGKNHEPYNPDASQPALVVADGDIQALVFRTLIDIMPDRIYAKDMQSRFILANKAVAFYMGKATPEEMIGKNDFDFYNENEAAQYFAVEQALIESGEPLVACEQLVQDLSTGKPGWLQTTKVHLRDSDGKVIGLVGIGRNITERKRIEAELLARNHELTELNAQLSAAQNQLAQAEKLAAIGQLAAGVAHEINNPIGYIFSNLNTLQTYMNELFELLGAQREAEKYISSPEVLARLEAMRERVDLEFVVGDSRSLMAETMEGLARVKHIVQDLKDFSRVDANSAWGWLDVHRGIDSALSILASEIKAKADVVKVYGNLPEIECLSSQVNQVFMNLLSNAAQAIGPERGTITIRTGVEGQQVWIEISDTGVGMAESVQARIFEPFFSTKPIGKSTGLGLSRCYGIVQQHSGRIEVRSAVGKGSTFRLSLPVCRAAGD